MKKARNHSFPKTYTTAGAVYRAKRNFEQRFPEKTFVVVKEDGKFVLDAITQPQEEAVSESESVQQ